MLKRRLERAYGRTKRQRVRAEMWRERALTKPKTGWCIYCGAPAANKVCAAHSDLLEIDPGAPE